MIALKVGGTVQMQPSGTPQATPEEAGTPQEEQATPQDRRWRQPVSVDMHEFAFNPNQFTIPANTDVQVTFTNSGALPHNFTCAGLNLKTEDVPPAELARQLTINAAAGATTSTARFRVTRTPAWSVP